MSGKRGLQYAGGKRVAAEADFQLVAAGKRADTFRGAGKDNVPAFKGEEAAHIGDKRHDFMDHVRSAALLTHFAVNLKAKRRVLRIVVKLGGGNKAGDRTGVIEALRLLPGAARLFQLRLYVCLLYTSDAADDLTTV